MRGEVIAIQSKESTNTQRTESAYVLIYFMHGILGERVSRCISGTKFTVYGKKQTLIKVMFMFYQRQTSNCVCLCVSHISIVIFGGIFFALRDAHTLHIHT